MTDDSAMPDVIPAAPSRLSFLHRAWFVALLLTACAGGVAGVWFADYLGKLPPRDLREAVYRALFAETASNPGITGYFLADEKGRSPDAAFMMRFEGHVPPVKPASDMSPGVGGGMGAKAKSGLGEALFLVESIQMTGPDSARVRAVCYSRGSFPVSFMGQCKRVRRKWTIELKVMGGLSDPSD